MAYRKEDYARVTLHHQCRYMVFYIDEHFDSKVEIHDEIEITGFLPITDDSIMAFSMLYPNIDLCVCFPMIKRWEEYSVDSMDEQPFFVSHSDAHHGVYNLGYS